MKNIVYPDIIFNAPFAVQGNKQIIPENQGAAGRATLTQGFPTETQNPLRLGGIAPNRTDFNGILYMLSAYAFWQQSGGMWKWRANLNYDTPCLVFHNSRLWWALQASGPNTSAGAKTPGTEAGAAYWEDFLFAVAGMAGGDANGIFGNPVGTIIMYASTTPPEGYLACDGSTYSATAYPKLYAVLGNKAQTPDMRGLFVRGYDVAGVNDPNGEGRGICTVQDDAIRNIVGSFVADVGYSEHIGEVSGAFYDDGPHGAGDQGYQVNESRRFKFDASRAVPTAAENRPKNISLLYCIKHD